MKKLLLILMLLTFIGVAQADYIPVWPVTRGGTGNTSGNAATVTNGIYNTDTGTVTNTMLAGSIANGKLSNSSLTVNGTSISLGASGTVTAAAGTLTGTTLNSTVTSSSLTSIGNGAALQTPASLVCTNCSGTAALLNIGGNAATVTTIPNLSGVITSSGNTTSITAQTGTGTTFAMSASPTFTGTVNNAGEIITSTSANSLAVGANGSTNPTLKIDNSVSSTTTGIAIQGGASGGGVTMTALDPSSTTSSIFFILPNAGTTGGIAIEKNGSGALLAVNNSINIKTIAQSFNANSGFSFQNAVNGNDGNLTAGSNVPYSRWSSPNSRGHAAGSLVLQEDFLINGATDTFGSASTLTNGATLGLTYKSCGTNATCTTESGIYLPTAVITGTIATSYGINVAASTGATSNIAGTFTDGTRTANLADGTNAITATGNISLAAAGNGLIIKSGSNARIGTGTLTAGTVTIANTSVTANTRVFLTDTSSSTTNVGSLTVSAISAGTSFTVTSTLALDTSTFNWMLVESQ